MTIGETIGNAVQIAVDVVVDIIKISIRGVREIQISRDIVSNTSQLYKEINEQVKKISEELTGLVSDISSVTKFIINLVRSSFNYAGGLTDPLSGLSPKEAYAKGKAHIEALL